MEQLDVLDLIINGLREHERRFDELLDRLELLVASRGEVDSHLPSESMAGTQVSSSSSNDPRPTPHPVSPSISQKHEDATQLALAEIDEDDEKRRWRELLKDVQRLLERHGYLSLIDLCRLLAAQRNWMAGFMSGLEAIGLVYRKGTRTHKLYRLTARGRQVLREVSRLG